MLYAVHRNSRLHVRAREWLTDQLNGSRRVGLPWQSLAAFPRIATHPRALDLPTFSAAGQRLYSRLTLIVSGGRVEHVFYPVFPPNEHAREVLAWLRADPAGGG